MKATILGCGEAFDDQLPNTCILIEGPRTMLLDCGYSAPPRVWQAVPDANAIDAIYISHAHADHYFGLPPLLGRMWEQSRTKRLTILSQPAVLEKIRQLLEMGYPGLAARFQYEIDYRCVVGPIQFEEYSLAFAPSIHSVPDLAIRIEHEGKTIAYSGDGMYTEESRRLYSGCDLVIHEAYAFEQLPIHADIPRLIEMAARENLGHLALVHVKRSLRRKPEAIYEAIEGRAVSMPEVGRVWEI